MTRLRPGPDLSVVAVALLLLASEGAIRIYQLAAHGIPFFATPLRRPDERFGEGQDSLAMTIHCA